MTPEEIIEALPEGNRKRAYQILQETLEEGETSEFWALAENSAMDAANLLVSENPESRAAQVLADMIWEG